MLRLVGKALGAVLRIAITAFVCGAVVANPLLDDVIGQFFADTPALTALREDVVILVPTQFSGRLREVPHSDDPVGPHPTEAELKFCYQYGEPTSLPFEVTTEDMRYDVDISTIWCGSQAERTRRARKFVDTYSRTPMISGMAGALRKEAKKRGLDREEYARLIVWSIQSIPYATAPGTTMKPPVRVMLDGGGDCDEKTVLCASILQHEGFDSAIFVFDQEAHAALGIKSSEEKFPGTTYTYVEMTEIMPVGQWGELETPSGDSIALSSDPLVVEIEGDPVRTAAN